MVTRNRLQYWARRRGVLDWQTDPYTSSERETQWH